MLILFGPPIVICSGIAVGGGIGVGPPGAGAGVAGGGSRPIARSVECGSPQSADSRVLWESGRSGRRHRC